MAAQVIVLEALLLVPPEICSGEGGTNVSGGAPDGEGGAAAGEVGGGANANANGKADAPPRVELVCVWWDTSARAWSEEGCSPPTKSTDGVLKYFSINFTQN